MKWKRHYYAKTKLGEKESLVYQFDFKKERDDFLDLQISAVVATTARDPRVMWALYNDAFNDSPNGYRIARIPF